MSNPLNGIDFDRWYVVVIVISLVVLLACVVARQPTYSLIAVGVLLFGIGELIQHPMRQALIPRGIITNRTRQWSVFGTLWNIAGIAAAARGVYLLL